MAMGVRETSEPPGDDGGNAIPDRKEKEKEKVTQEPEKKG